MAKKNRVKMQKRKAGPVSARKSQRMGKRAQKKAGTSKPGLGRSILSGAGAALGGWLGGPVGMGVGRAIGNGAATILGMGGYRVKANSLSQTSLVANAIPSMHTPFEGVRMCRREYLGDIITSSSAGQFNVQTWNINPGIQTTFPWASAVAQNFQQYRMDGLVFEFHSDCGTAVGSTNTALGSVIGAITYRASQQAFANKIQMLDEFWAQECRSCDSMLIPVECSPRETADNVFFVRGGAVPVGEDIKTYDLGALSIATVGCQGTSVNLGSLWAVYDVVLFKPLSATLLDLYGDQATYTFSTSITYNMLFGSLGANMTKVGDNIGMTLAGNTITFPASAVGDYVVTIVVTGASASTVKMVPASYVNCTNLPLPSPNIAYSAQYGGYDGGSYYSTLIVGVRIPNVSVVSTFGITPASGMLPGTPSGGYITITQMPSIQW